MNPLVCMYVILVGSVGLGTYINEYDAVRGFYVSISIFIVLHLSLSLSLSISLSLSLSMSLSLSISLFFTLSPKVFSYCRDSNMEIY